MVPAWCHCSRGKQHSPITECVFEANVLFEHGTTDVMVRVSAVTQHRIALKRAVRAAAEARTSLACERRPALAVAGRRGFGTAGAGSSRRGMSGPVRERPGRGVAAATSAGRCRRRCLGRNTRAGTGAAPLAAFAGNT